MASALELYYQNKKASPVLERRIDSELVGDLKKKYSPGFFTKLLDVLDRPGNATRALLVGKLGGLKGLIPFAQVIEDLTGWDVALNPDERVTGEQVINKLFGKQRQRKGKIDPVDVLGLLVEVVADPLWLVWGPGLTKIGKAKQLAAGAFKAGDKKVLLKAFQAAKAGKPLPAGIPKKLAKAFHTLHKAGAQPGLAKGWATQAAKGERAVLQLGLPGHRIPVVTGKKFFEVSEKATSFLKKSYLGKKFLPPTRRVSSRFSELHDIMIHHTRDLPEAARTKLFEKYSLLMKDMGKIGDVNEINKKLTGFVETYLSKKHLSRYIAQAKAGRVARAEKAAKTYLPRIERLKKKIDTQLKALEKAKAVPERIRPILQRVPKKQELGIVPEIEGFAKKKPVYVKPRKVIAPSGEGVKAKVLASARARQVARGYENQLAKLKNRILRLQAEGTPAANKQVRKLQKKLESMVKDKYISEIKGANRGLLRKYARQAERDVAAMKARVKVPQTLINQHEKELVQAHGRIERLRKNARRGDLKAYERARVRSVALQGRAKEIIESIPEKHKAKFEKMARGFTADYKKMLHTERALMVPAKELSDEALLGYVRRELTDDARKWLAQEKNASRFLRRYKSFGVRSGAQVRRRKFLAGMARDEIDDMFRGLGFKGENIFEPGIAQATLARGTMSARTTGSARGIHESIRKFSKPAAQAGDEAVVPVLDFAETTGLKITPAAKLEWADRVIPAEIAEALKATQEVVNRPDEIIGAVISMQRYMKGMFTIPFPAYHGRNALSNVFLNWIAGVKNPMSYGMAAKLQKAAHQTQKLVQQGIPWEQAVRQVSWPAVQTATGMTDGAAFWRLADEWGIIHRSLGEMGTAEVAGASRLQAGGRLAKRAHEKAWEVGRRGTMAIEDNARLAHFVEKMGHGLDPQTAARSVKKVLFDYGDLSQFEKKIMRDKVFFFYTFARKNLPLQLETLVTQPGKQALFAHMAGGTPRAGERLDYPDYWQERLTIPVGKKAITGTGLPIEEAFGPIAGPGVGGVSRVRRILSRAMSRLYPTMTIPMEAATGHQLYFDRPIKDWSRWAHQKMPYGRFYTMYGQMTRPGEPVGQKVLRHTLGPKLTEYEPETMAERKLKEISRRYLEGQKGVRTFRRPYIPKGSPSNRMIDLAMQLQ